MIFVFYVSIIENGKLKIHLYRINWGDRVNDGNELIKKSFEKMLCAPRFEPELLKRTLRPLAKAYGAVSVCLDVPIKANSKQSIYIYGDEVPGPEVLQTIAYEGRQIAGGRLNVTWYSGKELSDDEKDDIAFICKLVCVNSEKLRLESIANNYYYMDTTTTVSNINGLTRFVNNLIRRNTFSEYDCAFINVIGFNYVNKKVGFKMGTKVMKHYAMKLRDMLDKDEFVARPGGDNFVIIFRKENLAKILKICEGIAVRIRVNSASIRFDLSARAGIYHVSENDKSFDRMMSSLSNCIIYAKNYSKTHVVHFSSEVEHKVIEHKEFCQKFRTAIENEEFYVVYQPKVYTKNDTLYGGEALVRWNCDGKLIYPGEFVEIFEKEHMISELDFYVLERTCKDIRRWLDCGFEPVKVSVNFSNDHLGDELLLEKITEIVDRYGISHDLIEIEMTETVDVNEINQLLTYVEGLHSRGFTVAIDDFGIGYSSLLMLHSISVDVLKIDKAFVDEGTDNKNKRENVILKHIINMADELGVEIVAEGVETGDQRHNLTEMNCHRIQGYIYDKPLEADEFTKRLAVKNYC